ncbi:MAG: DNA repair protein RadA, partial [SAR202 cluster bacterium]|nr:DNA repair protein RadA [SAR202 cluster bacterium]
QVSQAQRRVNEADRLGLKKCILPERCLEGLTVPQGMKVIGVRTLRQAVNAVLTKDRSKSQNRKQPDDWTEDFAWEPEGPLEPD